MATIDSKLVYFGALCDQVSSEPSTAVKQEIISGFVSRYSSDLALLFKFLLPKFNGRLYYVQDKQLIKLFAVALKVTEKTLKDDLNISGCIALTVKKFFKPRPSAALDPRTGWCNLTLEDLDKHLEALSANKTEELQLLAIQKFLDVACKNTAFLYLRQVKQDLRLGAGIRTVLSGLHPSANDIFKRCANVQEVVRRIQAGATAVAGDEDDGTFSFDDDDDDGDGGGRKSPSPPPLKKGRVEALVKVGMPIAPMLAAPSKGVEHVLSKCPNGAYSEVKYDGERVQIHKDGDSWSFWARSLKPVKPDKYEGLEKYLKQAIKAHSCILDAEILMVDLETSKPLPFGTLGKHKKLQFATAVTGIFIFDILLKDGKTLMDEPLEVRRELIKSSVEFIPNRVMISEMRHVTGTPDQRKAIMQKHLNWAIAQGLEGLVIKDVKSVYAPGARHWLKLKKDYLDGMADSADLVVLGAYYGSGNKGGVLSTFLMGVWDKTIPAGGPKQFKTVCKVGNGHDDAKLASLNEQYKATMAPCVGKTAPAWIDIHSSHMPEMFVKDPMKADVWEIIGAEFSQTKTHTAAGISMRFPRVLKVRDDKDVASATSLQELKKLVDASKQKGHQFLPSDDDEGGDIAETDVIAAASVPAKRSPAAVAVPRAAAPQVTELPTGSGGGAAGVAYTGSTGVTYVKSEIAMPLADARAPESGILICHCTCIGGRWSNRGTMGSISKYIGDEPKEAYDEMSSTLKLGEVIFCEVSNRQSMGKMYVATMMGQRSPTKAGEVPQVDQPSLQKCLSKCAVFAEKHALTVHVAKLDRVTGVDWAACDKLLASIGEKTRVVVYSREGPLARTSTFAPEGGISPTSGTLRPSLTMPVAEGFTRLQAVATVAAPAQQSLSSGTFSGSSLPLSTADDVAFLKDVSVFLVDGFAERERMRLGQKVTMLGGKVVGSLAAATHVLAPSSDCVPSAGIPRAAHVVSKQWVDDSFERDKKLPEDAYRLSPSPPMAETAPAGAPSSLGSLQSSGTIVFDGFSGCRIVLASFPPKEAAELRSNITMCGGIVQETWKLGGADRSTHMVAAAWCPAAAKVSTLGGTVVSRGWIDACVERGKQVDFSPYILDEDAIMPAQAAHNQQQQQNKATTAASGASAPPPRDVLNGITVSFDGYGKAETQGLSGLVEAMGGVVVSPFNPRSCRYLICETLTATSAALADKSVVLTKAWLTACAEKRKLVRTEDYKYFSINVDDDDDDDDCLQQLAEVPPPQRRRAVSVDAKTESDHMSDKSPNAKLLNDGGSTTASAASTLDDNFAEESDTASAPGSRRRSRSERGGHNDEDSMTALSVALPPPILSGVLGAVFCNSDVKKRDDVERAFVAFGGHLLGDGAIGPARTASQPIVFIAHDENDVKRAHNTIRHAPSNADIRLAIVVSVSWLASCIKNKKLLPTLAFIASD